MIKLAVFDLDRTIAPQENHSPIEIIPYLKHLEEEGVKLMFFSTKPTIFIAGYVQSLGVSDAIIGGENGTDISFNLHYPIRKSLTYCEHDVDKLATLQIELLQKFGADIWFQPNNVNLCIYYKNARIKSLILKEIRNFLFYNDDFSVNKHPEDNAIEIHPCSADRGYAIKLVMEELSLTPNEVIAIGDSINDLPIFKQVTHSISSTLEEARYKVLDLTQGLNTIKHLLVKNKTPQASNIYYLGTHKNKIPVTELKKPYA